MLVDHALIGAEWDRLIGDVLAPALGGEPAAWGREKNRVFEQMFVSVDYDAISDPLALFRAIATHHIPVLCEAMGVPAPPRLVARGGSRRCSREWACASSSGSSADRT